MNINYLLSEDEAFIANVEDNYGRRGAKQAKELLAEVTGLFAGGEMADEDMREMVDAIQEAYLIAKNKKYTPKNIEKTSNLLWCCVLFIGQPTFYHMG